MESNGSYSKDLLTFDNVIDLSEFDPLAPSKSDSQSLQWKPLRAPPPPPEGKKTTQTVAPSSNLYADLLNLDFENQCIVEPPKSNGSSSQATYQSSEEKKSTFVSYVQKSDIDGTVSSSTRLTLPSVSTPATRFKSYVDSDPNKITSKVMGHRDELLQLFMKKRQDTYTTLQPFRIFAGTWNVNGQFPPDSTLEWTATDDQPPDLYVVGFQELDLSKEAFVFAESQREDEWVKVVSNSLHPKSKYKLIKHIRLVGMMLLMYAAEQHVSRIAQLVTHHVGTGLLGKMGNKGGVAVRFNIHNSTVCVVNSHLAAHTDMVQRRNEDYNEICSRMRFPDPSGEGFLNVFQHDVLIWLGDLNYRIDGMLPETVKECVENGSFKELKEKDQLYCQMREGNAFQYFEEGEVNFRPTYKYNPGTDIWDSSEKCRAPAWCDRILWRETTHNPDGQKKPRKALTLRGYRSHQTLMISDHKPVSALFDMNVRVIDKDLYRKVYEEEIRRLDRMENDWLPTMTLSQHSIEFGVVKFQEALERSVELHNTGQTPCHFEFIGKPGEANFCKSWLTISKPQGFILPGDKIEVGFKVCVDKMTASDLNSGVEKIEDILILHLEGGKDFFITLNGQYAPSCFGTSIESLCRMPQPIREIPQSRIYELSQIDSFNRGNTHLDPPLLQVPKELWVLLDHLHRNAMRQTDLFQENGLHVEMQQIQEVLDSQTVSTKGDSSLPGSNHSVAEALLVFLEALPDPVIPFCCYQSCIDAYNDLERSKQLLQSLSTSHRFAFNYLVSFLQEVSRHDQDNGLTTHHIATIFSGVIIRPKRRQTGNEARMNIVKATTFLENFLLDKVRR